MRRSWAIVAAVICAAAIIYAIWPTEPEKDGFCRPGYVVQPSKSAMGTVCAKLNGD